MFYRCSVWFDPSEPLRTSLGKRECSTGVRTPTLINKYWWEVWTRGVVHLRTSSNFTIGRLGKHLVTGVRGVTPVVRRVLQVFGVVRNLRTSRCFYSLVRSQTGAHFRFNDFQFWVSNFLQRCGNGLKLWTQPFQRFPIFLKLWEQLACWRSYQVHSSVATISFTSFLKGKGTVLLIHTAWSVPPFQRFPQFWVWLIFLQVFWKVVRAVWYFEHSLLIQLMLISGAQFRSNDFQFWVSNG